MSKKSNRIVYKNDNGKWVNKKVSAKKATSIHDTQKDAEKAAKNNLKNQGGGELITKGKDGKVVVNAFPGHSLTLGALGCFILWFAWYGFNGAAASDPTQLAQILGTTTIAPAVAAFACMLFTWIRNGAPDVSM